MKPGSISITIDSAGEVQAATTMDQLGTMQALGIALAKLAVIFRQKETQKIEIAIVPPKFGEQ